MSGSQVPEMVEVLSQDSPTREQALRLILSGATHPGPDVDGRIRLLRNSASARGLNLDLLVVASKGKQLTAACLAIESPGRSAIVHLSPTYAMHPGHNSSVGVLRELQDQAWQRGIVVLQAMVTPEETHLERVLSEAGFRFLAELIYAEHPREAPTPERRRLPKLELLTYSPQRHALFLRGLEQTYTESLDCADLSGVRRTEDILATHRAAGRHDPSLWFLARLSGETAGLLLLSPSPHLNTLEVAYMGVVCRFRRRGVGHTLMHKCNSEMIAHGFAGVALAVDSVNTPARALYRKWGFVETDRRRVWIVCRPS